MAEEDKAKTIGLDYQQQLLDLTENSRPIITSLTEIANENIIYADQITRAIELRIKNCLPNYKLFALYLMDSICKNIGNPYNVLFGTRLFQIFTSVYSVVSDSIRTKMINLFKTWKTGRTMTGLPLFQQDQIERIEQFLIKATSGNKIDKNFLIKDCQELLAIIEKRKLVDPQNEQKIQGKIEALNDLLRILVQTNPNQEELKFILEHFKNVRVEEQQILQKIEYEKKLSEERELRLLEQQRQQQQQQQQPKKELNLGFNLSDLSSFLSPQPEKRKSPEELMKLLENEKIKIIKPKINLSPEYLKFILNSVVVESQNVQDILTKYNKIDEEFIVNNIPSSEDITLLYDYNRFKCSVCGKRFPTQSSIQPHLDWHFRNNKRLKVTSSKTIQSRKYYIDEEEFINFKEIEIIGYGGGELVNPNDMDSQSTLNKQSTALEDQNKRHYVVIRSDNMVTKCSICKESVHGKYDDDLNEWIWDDCIEVKQKLVTKIYHWSCYNESFSNTPAPTTTTLVNGLNFNLDMLKDLVNLKKE